MGDSFGEGNADELPIHNVTLGSFNIGIYEVTQSEWARFMPAHTYDYGTGDNYPVYNVTWYEILAYCNKRSIASGLTPCYEISGNTDPDAWGAIPAAADSVWNAVVCNWTQDGYRLPTESEWEYAARGGVNNTDNYRYSGGESIDDLGWYIGNYFPGDFSHTTGLKQPNQLGLYDMSGNVSNGAGTGTEFIHQTARPILRGLKLAIRES
jgi:formylglycine-generating enzyme